MNVVDIENLTKYYGRTKGLDGASWSLPKGSLLGFLGPNGAGKSTTIRILLGLLKPTAGRSTVFGLDAWKRSAAIRARVGYLPGDVRLYRYLTGQQTVKFVAGARGMKDLGDAPRLAEGFQLQLATRVREYSKGMRQKLALILAMMHRPELLILDEPTASLDPLMQQVLYHELRAAAAEGRTVLFSSHSLAEAEALCDLVVILRAGCVVASKPVSALRKDAGQRVNLRFARSTKTTDSNPWDTHPDGFTVDKCQNRTLSGRWHGRPEALLSWLATLPLEEVVIHRPSLEDLFLAYYESDVGPTGSAMDSEADG
ncbi:MAG: ABC transporter ATP-binding protein [Phycisphaerae bacterium]